MRFIRYGTLLLFSLASLAAAAQTDTTVSFTVQGVCVQCKQRIQKALKIKGVNSANWNTETKIVTVTYQPSVVGLNDLHHTIAAVGHDTEKEKAPDAVYKALPECCHYREMMTDHSMMTMDSAAAANHLMGIVVGQEAGQEVPLAGASLSWAGTGQGTVTNAHGEFVLPRSTSNLLVISYAGYRTDTVEISLPDVQITLKRKEDLTGVVVTARQRSTYIDGYNPFRTA